MVALGAIWVEEGEGSSSVLCLVRVCGGKNEPTPS